MKHLNVLILALAFGPGLVSAGRWTGPFQLTTDTAATFIRRFPATTATAWSGRRIATATGTFTAGLTPQSMRGAGDSGYAGPGNNFNPVIAGGSCCVWEREEDSTSSIRAAFYNGQGQWADSAQIGLSRHAAGDWAEPSVTMVEGDAVPGRSGRSGSATTRSAMPFTTASNLGGSRLVAAGRCGTG